MSDPNVPAITLTDPNNTPKSPKTAQSPVKSAALSNVAFTALAMSSAPRPSTPVGRSRKDHAGQFSASNCISDPDPLTALQIGQTLPPAVVHRPRD
ncbi:MAG: hypothetical protein INR71_13405 [Terriglobus roseus]|nr:hypothetical protein [Terriglobus roseus]